MPELPEVETIARGLAKKIRGQVIGDVTLCRPDILHGNGGPIDGLIGRRIAGVCRRGKQVHIALDAKRRGCSDQVSPANDIYVHLGMTGRLTVIECKAPLERHTHLVMRFSGSPLQLRFCDPRRFGGIWMIAENSNPTRGEFAGQAPDWKGRRLPPVGADPLQVTLPALRKLLTRRRRIKALLMDQQPISGLGNIYCDEVLYRAGIHPLTPAARLDAEAVRRLRLAIRRVLNEAIRAGGSSISDYRRADNTQGAFQKRHRVYGRDGQTCRNCGTTIQRIIVAGRGTHICPCCQPLPELGA